MRTALQRKAKERPGATYKCTGKINGVTIKHEPQHNTIQYRMCVVDIWLVDKQGEKIEFLADHAWIAIPVMITTMGLNLYDHINFDAQIIKYHKRKWTSNKWDGRGQKPDEDYTLKANLNTIRRTGETGQPSNCYFDDE